MRTAPKKTAVPKLDKSGKSKGAKANARERERQERQRLVLAPLAGDRSEKGGALFSEVRLYLHEPF